MAKKYVSLFLLGAVVFALLMVFVGCDTEHPILTYHSVVFHPNGATAGTAPVFAMTVLVASPVTIPGNTGSLEKDGHEFIGWNTEADGSGNFFHPGDEFAMPAKNIVLYATWERLYDIGQSGPAGGIVFYDKGTRSDGWRYLEAAPVATEWVDRIWGEQYAVAVVGTSDAIGTGKANTQLIVDEYLDAQFGNYAASLCSYLEYGGFNDWFLPSALELEVLYENLYRYSLGSFSNDNYWSSTAYLEADDAAYIIYFATGDEFTSSTYYLRRVRAIRSF